MASRDLTSSPARIEDQRRQRRWNTGTSASCCWVPSTPGSSRRVRPVGRRMVQPLVQSALPQDPQGERHNPSHGQRLCRRSRRHGRPEAHGSFHRRQRAVPRHVAIDGVDRGGTQIAGGCGIPPWHVGIRHARRSDRPAEETRGDTRAHAGPCQASRRAQLRSPLKWRESPASQTSSRCCARRQGQLPRASMQEAPVEGITISPLGAERYSSPLPTGPASTRDRLHSRKRGSSCPRPGKSRTAANPAAECAGRSTT